MEILRLLHSWNRWLVLVVAVVAILYFALGLLQKRTWDTRANTLMRVFPILIDIQWLLGILFFIENLVRLGGMPPYAWLHAVTMTIAVIVAHIPARWRRSELPDATRYRNNLLVVVGVVAVIIVGIFILPQAIQWRFYTG